MNDLFLQHQCAAAAAHSTSTKTAQLVLNSTNTEQLHRQHTIIDFGTNDITALLIAPGSTSQFDNALGGLVV